MMNKIELIAQPGAKEKSLAEHTLEKLQDLVREDSENTSNLDDGALTPERSPSPSQAHSHETVNKAREVGDDTSKNGERVAYDDDGFEIPRGKVPLDGHFSAKEINHLIEMAQDGGLLDKNVRVLVEHGKFGDKVVVREEEEEEQKKQKKQEEEREKKEQEEKNEGEKEARNNETGGPKDI